MICADSLTPIAISLIQPLWQQPGVREDVKSSYARARLHALLAEMQRTGEPFMITYRGRPVAVLTPAPRQRRFGQLPGMYVPDDFDRPLPETEVAAWQDNSPV
jgi:prevent-host-death family protein